jgi:hypothetical protein
MIINSCIITILSLSESGGARSSDQRNQHSISPTDRAKKSCQLDHRRYHRDSIVSLIINIYLSTCRFCILMSIRVAYQMRRRKRECLPVTSPLISLE